MFLTHLVNFFKLMESWVQENQRIILFSDTIQQHIDHLEDLWSSSHSLEEYSSSFKNIFTNSNEFQKSMSLFFDHGCKSSPTFKYLFLFLLRLLRSERNAHFELHLTAVKETSISKSGWTKFTVNLPQYSYQIFQMSVPRDV